MLKTQEVDDKSSINVSVKLSEHEIINSENEFDTTQDFIENEILNELKSSCEELDTVGTTESLPLSEQDDIIKPVLQFNLGDSSNELKITSSSTTVLCNSSVSEEDSGFLSSEAIIAMRESDSALLENVRFVDADEDSVGEEKIEQKLIQKKIVSLYTYVLLFFFLF